MTTLTASLATPVSTPARLARVTEPAPQAVEPARRSADPTPGVAGQDAERAGVRAPTERLTLAGAMVQFFRYGSPRTLTLGLLLAVGARLSVGEWTWWDALIVFGFLTFEPLQEWLIHVHVLHWRPRRVLGVHIDPYLARKHRAHHRNPWTVPTLFIPLRTLALSFAANVALWSLVAPTWPLFLTALTMLLVIGFGYEWTHYLIHTPYRPRTRLFKLLFQHHRLHHFKNEHYWMGVTSDLGDRLLGTRPDARTVELSPTARDLLGEGAAGA